MAKNSAKRSDGRMRKTANYMGRKAKAALSGARQASGKAAVYVGRKAGKTARYLERNAKDSLTIAGQQSGQTAHYLVEQAHDTLSDAQAEGGRLAKRAKKQVPGNVRQTLSEVQADVQEGVARKMDETAHEVKKSVRAALDPGHARCAQCGRKFQVPGYCAQCASEMGKSASVKRQKNVRCG